MNRRPVPWQSTALRRGIRTLTALQLICSRGRNRTHRVFAHYLNGRFAHYLNGRVGSNRTGFEPGGVERFELPTSCSQSKESTRPRYTPETWSTRLSYLPRDFKSLVSEHYLDMVEVMTTGVTVRGSRNQNQVINSHLLSKRPLHPQRSAPGSRLVRATLSNSDQLAFNQLLPLTTRRGFEPLWLPPVAGMKTRCQGVRVQVSQSSYQQSPVDTDTYPRINCQIGLRINCQIIRDIHALTVRTLRINCQIISALAQSILRLQRCSCSYFLYLLFLYKDYLYCFANKGDNCLWQK